jgi:hypothetical protein
MFERRSLVRPAIAPIANVIAGRIRCAGLEKATRRQDPQPDEKTRINSRPNQKDGTDVPSAEKKSGEPVHLAASPIARVDAQRNPNGEDEDKSRAAHDQRIWNALGHEVGDLRAQSSSLERDPEISAGDSRDIGHELERDRLVHPDCSRTKLTCCRFASGGR